MVGFAGVVASGDGATEFLERFGWNGERWLQRGAVFFWEETMGGIVFWLGVLGEMEGDVVGVEGFPIDRGGIRPLPERAFLESVEEALVEGCAWAFRTFEVSGDVWMAGHDCSERFPSRREYRTGGRPSTGHGCWINDCVVPLERL